MTTTFRILHWFSRLALAGIFIYSGYVKFGGIAILNGHVQLDTSLQFVQAIEGYKLVPAAVVWPLAKYLPLFEMALGVLLLSGWKIRGSASMAAGLLLFFIAILTITYARGIEANCGCFSLSEKISPKTIARDSIMLLPAIFLIFEARLLSHMNKSREATAG